jgi:hypothetical protein
MRVLTEPAMPRNFEEVRTLPRVRYQYPPQQIAGVGGDILWECQRGCNYVLVQQVDVVAVRIRRIVIEW